VAPLDGSFSISAWIIAIAVSSSGTRTSAQPD